MRNRFRKLSTLIGVTLAAVVAVPLGATAASAAPAAGTVVESAGMRITGFDKAVAAANGYEIRTTPDGRQYSVPKGSPAVTDFTNLTEVYGNCGMSYLYYNAIGNRKNRIETGFKLTSPAVSYWWLAVLKDDGGQSSKTWAGGLLARRNWGVNSTVSGMTPGFSQAYISTGSSAILVNGGVCTSGGPSDFTWTY